MVQVVANNLKRLRTERGVSVSELARRSGVGRGTLTSLEAGKGNPTIETLWALAGALGVPFGDLSSDNGEVSPEVLRAEEGARVVGSGAEVRLVERVPGRRLLEVYEMNLDSGDRREAVAHVEGVVEYVFLNRGTLLTGPADDPVELGPGDSARFAGDRPHVYAARGEDAVHALVLVDYPASPTPEDGRNLSGGSLSANGGSALAYSKPHESGALDHVRKVIERAWVEVGNGLEAKRSVFSTDPFKTREIERLVVRHRDALVGEGRLGKHIRSFVVTEGAEVSLVSFPKNLGPPSRYSAGQGVHGRDGGRRLDPDGYPRTGSVMERAEFLCRLADALAGQALPKGEVEFLEDLAEEPAWVTSTLAAEILTRNGRPAVSSGLLGRDDAGEDSGREIMPRTMPSYATDPRFEDRIDVRSYDLFEAVHPAYAAQCVVLARAVRRLLGNDGDLACADVGSGPGVSLLMLLELLPDLRVRAVEPSAAAFARLQRNFDGEERVLAERVDFLDLGSVGSVHLITSVGSSHHLDTYSFFRKAHDLLEDEGKLLVADEFLSPFDTTAERERNLVLHHSAYMLALMVDVPDEVLDELALDEQALINRFRNDLPLAVSHAREDRLRVAARLLRELLECAHSLTLTRKISHPLVAFYRTQVLELEALVAGLDYEVECKTYPERFEQLARAGGFEVVEHHRVYATVGSRGTDAGTHVFALQKARI